MGQLDLPRHMTIDPHRSFLVADHENHRIVQLSTSLEYMNEFAGFQRPIRLLLTEELGRLYIIEMSEQSITILDI